MFDKPPGCWLHRQASFINAFFPEDGEAGVDYDWFPLPPIDQDGTLFAGELAVDVPATRRRSKDFLTRSWPTTSSARWAATSRTSRISPNVNVGPDCYANPILADASVVLTEALDERHASGSTPPT